MDMGSLQGIILHMDTQETDHLLLQWDTGHRQCTEDHLLEDILEEEDHLHTIMLLVLDIHQDMMTYLQWIQQCMVVLTEEEVDHHQYEEDDRLQEENPQWEEDHEGKWEEESLEENHLEGNHQWEENRQWEVDLEGNRQWEMDQDEENHQWEENHHWEKLEANRQ